MKNLDSESMRRYREELSYRWRCVLCNSENCLFAACPVCGWTASPSTQFYRKAREVRGECSVCDEVLE